MLKIVWALRMGTGRAFHKDAPAMEKALDPVLLLYTENEKFIQSVNILSISAEKISQQDLQIGCLLRFGKFLCIF